MDTDKSFDGNVRNFLAELNSPNCLGKVKEFSVEKNGSDSSNTFETYSIESDFNIWNKVSEHIILNYVLINYVDFV